MKVYVLSADQAVNWELVRPYGFPMVFANLEDAKREFKKYVDEEKEYFKEHPHDSIEWVTEKDTDMEYEAYEDGNYDVNHTYIVIEEKEVL